jgi:putative cell wall-binding protein/Tol biopolymer transport system component
VVGVGVRAATGSRKLKVGRWIVVAVVLGVVLASCATAVALPAPFTVRASLGWDGAQSTESAIQPALSGDGRFAVFSSSSENLVSGDPVTTEQVYLRDLTAATTEIASKGLAGVPSDGNEARNASLSYDGRYVAFDSTAKNLVSGFAAGLQECYVRDRQTGVVDCVSAKLGGGQDTSGSSDYGAIRPSVSGDGRYVAFESRKRGLTADVIPVDAFMNVFLRDRLTNTTKLISKSTSGVISSDSWLAEVSANGRFVAFVSYSKLVPEDTDAAADIYVYDVVTDKIERVSVANSGAQGSGGLSGAGDPSISADGRFVAFQSDHTDLVAGDTNAHVDAFVRDRLLGKTVRVSVSSAGAEAPGGAGEAIDISGNGRYVVFNSDSSGLVSEPVNGSQQVFMRDLVAGTTRLVSVSLTGGMVNAYSGGGCLDYDGSAAGFISSASDVVAGDTNGVDDMFVRMMPVEKPVNRLGGANRYDVTRATAEAAYPGWVGVKHVVLASGEDRAQPDALTAAGLAGVLDAPLMLVPYSGVNGAIQGAIAAMPKGVQVHIVGGTASVSTNVERQLRGYGNVASVDRTAGSNRYGTASAVARRMKTELVAQGKTLPNTALITNGNFAGAMFDALTASAISAHNFFPVLLVKDGSVPGETSAALAELGLSQRYIIGGTTSVKPAVQSALGVPAANRIAGATRYSTATAAAMTAKSKGWLANTLIGFAAKVPDAATGGAFMGKRDGALVYVTSAGVPGDTAAYLTANKATILDGGMVFGGTTSVPEKVRTQLQSLLQ